MLSHISKNVKVIFFQLLRASGYWLMSLWQHPDEPLSVIAMYRVGDIQFYPVISAISNFNFGETVLFEHLGDGILFVNSIFVCLPYALGLRFFGPAGFIIADISIALCYYVILSVLLRIFKIPKFLSECTSLLMVSGVIGVIYHPLVYQTIYKILPRPLILLILNVIFLSLILIVQFLREPKEISKPLLQLGLIASLIVLFFSTWYARLNT